VTSRSARRGKVRCGSERKGKGERGTKGKRRRRGKEEKGTRRGNERRKLRSALRHGSLYIKIKGIDELDEASTYLVEELQLGPTKREDSSQDQRLDSLRVGLGVSEGESRSPKSTTSMSASRTCRLDRSRIKTWEDGLTMNLQRQPIFRWRVWYGASRCPRRDARSCCPRERPKGLICQSLVDPLQAVRKQKRVS
jgi:hypothetical protein